MTVTVCIPNCPSEFNTLGQGGWAAPVVATRDPNMSTDKINGVMIDPVVSQLLDGNTVVIGKLGQNYMKVNPGEGKYLRLVLPAAGPAVPLPAGTAIETCHDMVAMQPILNGGRFNNVLIGEVLAMELNLRLNKGGDTLINEYLHELGNMSLTSTWCSISRAIMFACFNLTDPAQANAFFASVTPRQGQIPQTVLDALALNSLPSTVYGLRDLAQCFLAGDNVGVSGDDLALALSEVNTGFEGSYCLINSKLCECLTASDL